MFTSSDPSTPFVTLSLTTMASIATPEFPSHLRSLYSADSMFAKNRLQAFFLVYSYSHTAHLDYGGVPSSPRSPPWPVPKRYEAH